MPLMWSYFSFFAVLCIEICFQWCKIFVLNFNVVSALCENFSGAGRKFGRISKVCNDLNFSCLCGFS